MKNTEKSFRNKASTIFVRMANASMRKEYKCIYAFNDNIYVTNNGYLLYMIKGNPIDFDFKSVEVVFDDDLENMMIPHITAYHEKFTLPTIKELKEYIKEHEYSRVKNKISEAIYKLENDIYINAFYLLDALEICKSKPSELAKGYWSGEKIYIGENKEYYTSKGAIEIVSADGGNVALIAPLKALREKAK